MYQSGSVNSGKVKLGISTITDISRPEPIAVAVKEKNISLYSRATSIQQQLATPVRAAPTSHTPFRYPRLPTHPTVQLLYNPHTRPSGIRYYHTPYSTASILTHTLQVPATTTHPTVQLQSSHTHTLQVLVLTYLVHTQTDNIRSLQVPLPVNTHLITSR